MSDKFKSFILEIKSFVFLKPLGEFFQNIAYCEEHTFSGILGIRPK